MSLVRRSQRDITKPRRAIDSSHISRIVVGKFYDDTMHWECYYYGVRLNMDKEEGYECNTSEDHTSDIKFITYFKRVTLDELALTMKI